MVTTRGQKPAIGAHGIVNPTLRENWPDNPVTDTQFVTWMAIVKSSLLQWMKESRALAQDDGTKTAIKEFTQAAYEEWKEYRLQTDEQTGCIFDELQQRHMEDAMRLQKKDREALHKSRDTWRKFAEYRTSLAAWEDFLYYQNVWNRKEINWKAYFETATEKKALKRARQKAAKSRGPEKEFIVGDPKLGTPKTANIGRMDEAPNGVYYEYYGDWLANLFKIYTRFHLGYRKRMPDVVGPESAHRYTQPSRGTTPLTLARFVKRHRYLEERLPRERRIEIDPAEVEEQRRTKEVRAEDIRHEKRGAMVPIRLTLDEKACEDHQDVCENRKNDKGECYREDIRTQRLLPKGHQLHHGSQETSFDWPTSFDSNDWGNRVSKTGVKPIWKHDEFTDTDTDFDGDDTKLRKSKKLRYKHNENGDRIFKKATGRFVQRTVSKPARVFEFDMNDDDDDDLFGEPTVVGRDKEGTWQGTYVEGEEEEEIQFELNADGERILKPPQWVPDNVFIMTNVTVNEAQATRLGRHMAKFVTDQLSADESEGRAINSTNYGLSGNANPDQVGNPTHWTDEEVLDTNRKPGTTDKPGKTDKLGGTDKEGLDKSNKPGNTDEEDSDTTASPGDSDDDSSDDDGDLFKRSYEECSECPIKKRAREMLAALHGELGVYEFLAEDQLVPWLKDGMEYDEMRAQYVVLMNASRPKPV